MRRLYVPANDDTPTDAWVEFKADRELFARCLELDSRLTWSLKNRYGFPKKEEAERRAGNLIWFMKFEMSFRQSEKETEPPFERVAEKPKLELVK